MFQSTYLFGAFSPIDGHRFLLELPHCNTDNFQLFLEELALQQPEEFKLVVLDNGAFHKAKRLQIPPNIALLFLPPYSPELNPAEKMWAKFKRDFTNRLFKTLDELSAFIETVCHSATTQLVKSTCAYNYIFLDKYWTI